jgi:FMN phosphatase YigB (HAD superfamily)
MKTILVDAVSAFVSKDGVIFQEMYELLEKYPNKKILLTGANDEQYKNFGLDKMPYEVFTLKHNPEKSEPEYFEIFLKRYNLNKGDVVYFEHSEEAYSCSKALGIETYFYDSEKKDLIALKGFLDNELKGE